MPAISNIRCVLLSGPYADKDEPEIKACFPNGPKRTIGMVEVTLDNGVTGLGEGYLAVFAPLVFKSIVELCSPQVLGRDGFDIDRRVANLRSLCDYWSLQGAARHVISAFDIALHDAKAKFLRFRFINCSVVQRNPISRSMAVADVVTPKTGSVQSLICLSVWGSAATKFARKRPTFIARLGS